MPVRRAVEDEFDAWLGRAVAKVRFLEGNNGGARTS